MIVYIVSESKQQSKFQAFKQKVAPTLKPIIQSLRKFSESDSDYKLSESDDVNRVINYDS